VSADSHERRSGAPAVSSISRIVSLAFATLRRTTNEYPSSLVTRTQSFVLSACACKEKPPAPARQLLHPPAGTHTHSHIDVGHAVRRVSWLEIQILVATMKARNPIKLRNPQ
jgi:hypothetical protein